MKIYEIGEGIALHVVEGSNDTLERPYHTSHLLACTRTFALKERDLAPNRNVGNKGAFEFSILFDSESG